MPPEGASILGMGIDLVDLKGFRQQLNDPASGFVDQTFTRGERDAAVTAPGQDSAPHLAVRFAAKEALIKAWSIARWGQTPTLSQVDMRHIEVIRDSFGRPNLKLHGAVDWGVRQLTPSDKLRIHLSLTHDGDYASAVVLLERTQ